jgi:tetratricopeptide (TPR) repeat protein
VISHWEENEQRGHLFGYWFGHDMFTPPFTGKDGKPLFPEMDRDTVLFGGTDPGRFNPTYMIFCESFIPPSKKSEDPNFDRRDVYLITQNALADGTYLNYIRAHYNRSAQIDPPFFQEFLRPTEETAKNYKTNLLARMAIPLDRFFLKLGDNIEKRRRVGSSFFKDDHFANLADLAKKINSGGEPAALSKFIKENLSEDTRSKLGQPDKALAKALAKDLNVLLEKELVYEPNRFTGVTLKPTTMRFINQNPKSHTRIRLNRLLLEEAYPKDIIKSLGGVYPDREIITPSPADSQKCFQEYLEDAQKRFANHQLRPGEDVRVEGGRVQVSGQVAVMAINALLTKVIFDKNPDHEFYVEESFPLDWMYPYLTPFGIIMKINRNPLPELPQDTIDRDHEFWSKYSDRLIGNWITYDTPVSNVCDFAERIYLHRDYSKFKGDPKFIRDDNAQKAFSKLRSSIGGVYNWRIANARNQPERDRMIKEAEFAFKQALAYCPFSPEAVFRYVNLLLSLNQPGRLDDAIKIAQTCKKLDPSNAQVDDLMRKLKEIRQSMGTALEMQSKLSGIEGKFKSEPTVSNAFSLANVYMSLGRSNDAVRVLGAALNHPQTDAGAVISIANAFVQLNQVGMLEQALGRLVTLTPDSPEAWYDYAGVLSIVGKTTNAVESLTKALALSGERMKKDTKARNLKDESLKDPRFNILRGMPEFQKLLDQK